MAGADIGDVVEVTLIGNYQANDNVINVFKFENLETAFSTDEDLLDDVEALLVLILALVKTLSTAQTAWSKFRARNLTKNGITLEQNFGTPVLGTQAGNNAPPGTCALVNFKTEFPRVQLRKFFGVPATALMTSTGYMSGTGTTIMTNIATLLLADINTAGSRWRYGFYPYGTPTFAYPTSAVVTNVVAYQRRRRPGRGS